MSTDRITERDLDLTRGSTHTSQELCTAVEIVSTSVPESFREDFVGDMFEMIHDLQQRGWDHSEINRRVTNEIADVLASAEDVNDQPVGHERGAAGRLRHMEVGPVQQLEPAGAK